MPERGRESALALSDALGYNVAGVLMDLAAELKNRVLIFDGAMGTLLYDKGYFLNACYEQLALTAPAVIEGVHRDYLKAGADVLTTDTFGANPLRLAAFGLEDRTDEINEAAVRAARRAIEAEGARAFVAGDIGPCSFFRQRGSAKKTVLRDAFCRQAEALARAGADFFLLETFTRLSELLTAAQAASGFGLPVAASFTPPGNTGAADEVDAEGVAAFVTRLNDEDCVQAVGLNCGSGPAALFSAAEVALKYTRKPLIVMPNAGLPRMVDGRLMYLTNPEYFTEYAKRYAALGVRGIGGCCGTTPEHIREAAAALKPLLRTRVTVEAPGPAKAAAEREPVPAAERSRLAARIFAGEKVTSVEMVSPGGADLTPMLEKVKLCREAGVDAVNIPDGPRANSRISPMIAAAEIERRIGIETVLHYCCRDRNLIGIQADLLGAAAVGLRNLLLITGDPPKLGSYPQATGVFDIDSVGLVQTVSHLNRGVDPAGRVIEPPTAFFAGVGLNPCAVNLEAEKEHFLEKVKAGAEFCITQPVFDPEALLSVIRWMKEAGAAVPVIAGIWPLTGYKNAEFMKNEVPGVVLPDELLRRMSKTRTKEEGLKEGADIAREMVAAVRDEVAGIQVSAPFGRIDIALDVLEAL